MDKVQKAQELIAKTKEQDKKLYYLIKWAEEQRRRNFKLRIELGIKFHLNGG